MSITESRRGGRKVNAVQVQWQEHMIGSAAAPTLCQPPCCLPLLLLVTSSTFTLESNISNGTLPYSVKTTPLNQVRLQSVHLHCKLKNGCKPALGAGEWGYNREDKETQWFGQDDGILMSEPTLKEKEPYEKLWSVLYNYLFMPS